MTRSKRQPPAPSPSSLLERLRAHGIQPSAQRLAILRVLDGNRGHPSAERIWREARRELPLLSRATVYATLRLFQERGLVRQLVLVEGRTVFDPNPAPHHHFVDESTGRIYDLPADSLEVRSLRELPGFEVREVQVVLRGRALPAAGPEAGEREPPLPPPPLDQGEEP